MEDPAASLPLAKTESNFKPQVYQQRFLTGSLVERSQQMRTAAVDSTKYESDSCAAQRATEHKYSSRAKI